MHEEENAGAKELEEVPYYFPRENDHHLVLLCFYFVYKIDIAVEVFLAIIQKCNFFYFC